MEIDDVLMPSFVADDGDAPSSVTLWRRERAFTGSTPNGGALPPSFAVRQEGRAVPGSNPYDGTVPSSVAVWREERVVTGFFCNDGTVPPSFAV